MVLLSDLLDPLHIAQIAVDVNRKDGTGPVRDQTFQHFHIHGIIFPVNVTKYRSQPVSHDRVGGGGKTERGGDHLPLQLHGLQSQLQSHVAVDEQLQTGHIHILLQFLFKLLVISPHVGEPDAVPDGL